MKLEHLKGHTFHKRLGETKNSFRYGVDYVLLEPEAVNDAPFLFSRNKPNIVSQYDTDNGGTRSAGRGTDWVRETLRNCDLADLADMRVLLLTQPRVLGHVFNPVSFWLIMDADEALRCVIAEVNNTFKDRHSYLCHHDDLRPIQPSDVVSATKRLHVSPFQPIAGGYTFRFNIADEHIGIRIDLRHDGGGVIATLAGKRKSLTNIGILQTLLMRPAGSLRVLGLIYYQALKLKIKGARYRSHPKPPAFEVSK